MAADLSNSLSDISFLIAVSMAHAFQLASNAISVGASRRKHKVDPPRMDGPPEFIRTLRVQANDLEFAIPFQVALWSCGLTTHQGIACVFGLLYIYARRMYKKGYIEDVKKRVPGFKLSVLGLRSLSMLTAVGLINVWLAQFVGVDVFGTMRIKIMEQISGLKDEL